MSWLKTPKTMVFWTFQWATPRLISLARVTFQECVLLFKLTVNWKDLFHQARQKAKSIWQMVMALIGKKLEKSTNLKVRLNILSVKK